jgi:hypothetical protein
MKKYSTPLKARGLLLDINIRVPNACALTRVNPKSSQWLRMTKQPYLKVRAPPCSTPRERAPPCRPRGYSFCLPNPTGAGSATSDPGGADSVSPNPKHMVPLRSTSSMEIPPRPMVVLCKGPQPRQGASGGRYSTSPCHYDQLPCVCASDKHTSM